MAYTIQIGAFSKLRNAERATAVLQDQGLDAYFFVHKTGLYKVRFGDFPSRTEARRRAEALRAAGIIDRYYLVGPEDYATTRQRVCGTPCLREEITKTAQRFLGVPYRFGSSSPKKGFDCSGFVMTVYRLNGLRLPRASADQWRAGRPVRIRQLSKGDLVFFATSGQGRISHVGIYMGKNRFIHAPSRGKKIRFGSLSNDYFKRRFMGARTYL
jgi:cell wall-associated NlpC family hydrolase